MKKIYFIILFSISFVTCNNLTQTSDQPIDEFEKDNNQNIEEPTSTTTTSSSSTTTTEFVCPPDNNTGIDFDNIKNVQIFLNKYGFNAGDEDGYLGPQTTNAIINPDIIEACMGVKPKMLLSAFLSFSGFELIFSRRD